MTLYGKITEYFIKNRKLSFLILLAIVLWGGISFKVMPKQYNPDIVAPAFSIDVVFPNATVDEVYHLVTRPLEDVLKRLPKTTQLILDSGEPVSVALTWSPSEFVVTGRGGNPVRHTYLPKTRGSYEMVGTFMLPEGVTRDPSQPLLVRARVNVQGGPLATLDNKELFDQPGKYQTHCNQRVY